jgi:amino acid adenylation domain-containing protein
MDRQSDNGAVDGTSGDDSHPFRSQDRITPQMFPLVELDQPQLDRIVETVPGGASNVQDIYPLSPLQEGMLFHHILDREHDTYVLSAFLQLHSRHQLAPLLIALQTVIDRHDVLRTAVLWEGLPRPVQVVYRRAQLSLEEIVLDQVHDALEQLKERMTPGQQQIDVRQAPLVRLVVAGAVNSSPLYVALALHHLICDHQSLRIVIAETLKCFDGKAQELPAPVPYRKYVAHTLTQVQNQDAEAFFRGKVGDVTEPTIPFGLSDVYTHGGSMDEARVELPLELAHRLRARARALDMSPARLFHSAWALVVAHTSGQQDVVYGTVILAASQRSVNANRMLGLTVNTLPLRLRLQGVTAREAVEQVNRELAELLNYQDTPLTLAQQCSGIVGKGSLFSALLNYRHSAPTHAPEPAGSVEIRLLERGEAWTNYPITLLVDDEGEGFTLTAQTDPRINPNRIARFMCAAVRALVEALEVAPETPVLSLSILPEDERRQVVEVFNATEGARLPEKLIHELIEEAVERSPGSVALEFERQSFTYAELNGKANQLARFLRRKGVGPDLLVGISVERGVEMVVGLLGILKAGGAYVPVDPGYPPERLAYMLNDAAPKVLLTQVGLRKKLPEVAAEIIALDEDWDSIAQEDPANLDSKALGLRSDHLAYVIYTSGSTGNPKGAMNEHGGVVNRIRWMQDQYGLNSKDRVLQKTPFSFDVSVWEFFWTLMSGARLIIARPEGHKDPAYLRNLIEETGVTTLHFVPSMLQNFLHRHSRGECPSLCHVVCSGEELSAELQRKCFECLPQVRLSNLYGPTEAAIDVTAWGCQPNDQSSRVPIGRPITNIKIYILDCYGHHVPIGVTGEIHIGGVGLGRGYWNRPDLTAERFLPDPFSAHPKARMYKTGDLGLWRTDGAIEYLGRNDHQVKIRGFRIECAEVQAHLSSHAQVKEVVVICREDVPGEKCLVAYVVLNKSPSFAYLNILETLRAHLKPVLPEHMVPSAFVVLERMPLTPNGKLDRRSLPAPGIEAYSSKPYEPPQGQVEELLAGIWQALLPVELVGREDNFFELGGHSLLATRLVSRIRARLEVDLPVKVVFDAPTLRQLSDRINAECVKAERDAQAPQETLPMSHISRGVRREIDQMGDDEVLAEIAELKEQLGNSTSGDSMPS